MLDIVASRVHGAVTAKDCRVVWTEGKLYVVRTVADIVVLDSPEPKKIGGAYKASTEQGDVRIQPPGCGSCRARVRASDIGQMSLEQITAAGLTVDA